MFTKVMSEFVDSANEFNRFRLYQKFMSRIVTRETAKPSRATKSRGSKKAAGYDDPRSVFMQEVAWWLLCVKRENRFLASDLPPDIVPTELREASNNDSALREALLGSIIEHAESGVLGRKGAKTYYFPHKSYIEYLVAVYFIRSKFSVDMYRNFMDNVNEEILSFLDEGPSEGRANLREGLRYAVGTVDKRILDIGSRDRGAFGSDSRGDNMSAADVYLHYAYIRREGSDSATSDFLKQAFISARLVPAQSAVINCACDFCKDNIDKDLMRSIFVNSFTNINLFSLRDYIDRGIVPRLYLVDHNTMRAAVVMKAVRFDRASRSVRFSLSTLFDLARRAAGNSLFVQFGHAMRDGDVRFAFDDLAAALDDQWTMILKLLIEDRGSDRIAHRFDGDAEVRFG